MKPLTRALALLALAALLIGLLGAAVVLASDHVYHRGLTAALGARDRRRLGRHRPLRLGAAARKPRRGADDLDGLRVAADRCSWPPTRPRCSPPRC